MRDKRAKYSEADRDALQLVLDHEHRLFDDGNVGASVLMCHVYERMINAMEKEARN